MPYRFYIILHVAGIMMLFMSLGGYSATSINDIPKPKNLARKWLAAFHGFGTLVILVSGFGLMARTNIEHGEPWPTWLIGKMAIWFVLASFIALIPRIPKLAPVFLFLAVGLGGTNAWLATYKLGVNSTPAAEETEDEGEAGGENAAEEEAPAEPAVE